MSVHHVLAQCLWRPEEDLGPLGLELQAVASCHMGAGWESNLGPQEEQ